MHFTGETLSHSLLPGHDPWLVGLAILVAVLASFVAFDLGQRIRVARGAARLLWLAGGAVAMGGGIWSMHFIAMLALHLPVGFAYDLPLTLLSLLIAAVATGAGFTVATLGQAAPDATARPGRMSPLPLLAGGLCLGLGIAGMHYVGMAAILAPGRVVYDPVALVLSVLVALIAATAALHLALSDIGRIRRILAALVMGAAISGMHFIGMAAARFVPDPAAQADVAGTPVPPTILAGLVAAAAIVVLALAVIATRLDRRISELQAKRQLDVLDERHAATLNALPMPLALIDGRGTILTANPPWQWPGERERFVGGGSRPGEDYFALCGGAGAGGRRGAGASRRRGPGHPAGGPGGIHDRRRGGRPDHPPAGGPDRRRPRRRRRGGASRHHRRAGGRAPHARGDADGRGGGQRQDHLPGPYEP